VPQPPQTEAEELRVKAECAINADGHSGWHLVAVRPEVLLYLLSLHDAQRNDVASHGE
jgi:hypothetical protein